MARSMERLYTDPTGELDRWAHQFVVAGGDDADSQLLMTMTYAIKEGFSYERREGRRAVAARDAGAAPRLAAATSRS